MIKKKEEIDAGRERGETWWSMFFVGKMARDLVIVSFLSYIRHCMQWSSLKLRHNFAFKIPL